MVFSTQKWVKHYSVDHKILLVGEGDFSFSLCLGRAFGSASNIVATSFDSYDELINKYKSAKTHLELLKLLGASVLHEVDATRMRMHPCLQLKKFDRIVYNFPHAGFHGKEGNPDMIMMHRTLVLLFLQSASSMLFIDGEIHVSHKITAPFDSWRIEDLALECPLLYIGQEEFRIEDYPGYNNKRGSYPRPDEPFPLGACRTFKFKLSPAARGNMATLRMPPMHQMLAIPRVAMQQHIPVSVNELALHDYKSECHRIFGSYLNYIEETFGSSSYDVRQSVNEALWAGFEMYMDSAGPRRPLSGFTAILEELHHLSILRSHRLRGMLSNLDHRH